MRNIFKNQRGDTIVEVLIATAVISLVLTSAYALTNRNTTASQKVQEQMTALKLAERQSEQLLGAQTAPTTSGCYDSNNLEATGSVCIMNGEGDEYDPANDGGAQYDVSIVKDPSTNTYAIRVEWDDLSSNKAFVSIYARRSD